jgi:hypothetical protein
MKNKEKKLYKHVFYQIYVIHLYVKKRKFETKRILCTTNNIFQPNSSQFKLFITIKLNKFMKFFTKLNKVKHQNKLLLFSISQKHNYNSCN